MNLTREQLIRAKDVQLQAIGLTRKSTTGWLKRALSRVFTESEIAAFNSAISAPKIKTAPKEDNNVEAVRRKLEIRARIGLRKYGVTTERTDFKTLDWLKSAQEEAMDLAVYLERLIRDEERRTGVIE